MNDNVRIRIDLLAGRLGPELWWKKHLEIQAFSRLTTFLDCVDSPTLFTTS